MSQSTPILERTVSVAFLHCEPIEEPMYFPAEEPISSQAEPSSSQAEPTSSQAEPSCTQAEPASTPVMEDSTQVKAASEEEPSAFKLDVDVSMEDNEGKSILTARINGITQTLAVFDTPEERKEWVDRSLRHRNAKRKLDVASIQLFSANFNAAVAESQLAIAQLKLFIQEPDAKRRVIELE